MKPSTISRWLTAGVALAMFSGFAWAQAAATTATTAGTLSSTWSNGLDSYAGVIEAMRGAAHSMEPYLVGEGLALTSVLFGISAFVHLIKLLLAPHDPSVKANILILMFKGILVTAMLSTWCNYGTGPDGETVSPVGNTAANISKYKLPVSVESVAVTPFDGLANGVFAQYGGGSGKDKVVTTIAMLWGQMWQASDQRSEMREKAWQNMQDSSGGGSIWQKLVSAVTLPFSGMALLVQTGIDKIVTFVVTCIICIMCVWMIFEYLYVIYYGDVLAYIGMFVGPLMVPGLLWERVEFLFNSWLKWMIAAGFFKLIAAWVAICTLKTIQQVQTVSNGMYQNLLNNYTAVTTAPSASTLSSAVLGSAMFDVGFILSLAFTFIFMMFGIRMMKQTPGLAQALINGQPGSQVSVMMGAMEGGGNGGGGGGGNGNGGGSGGGGGGSSGGGGGGYSGGGRVIEGEAVEVAAVAAV